MADAEAGAEALGVALTLALAEMRGRLGGGGAGADEQSLSSEDEGMWGTWWRHQVENVLQWGGGSQGSGGFLYDVDWDVSWFACELNGQTVAARWVGIPS